MDFSMMKSKQAFLWDIDCSDGSWATIRVQLNGSTRDPIDIIVDSKKIATVKVQKKGIIPNLEYEFLCGDDKVKLIVYGSTVDLVHNGVLQNSKIVYAPLERLPNWYRVFLILLNLCSLTLYFNIQSFSSILGMQLFLSIPLALSGSILSNLFSTTPFYGKKKKIVCSLLITIWNWSLMIAIFHLLPTFIDFV